MLKKLKNKLSRRKNSALTLVPKTPGEMVRDSMIAAGMKAIEESAYVAGNKTEQVTAVAQKVSDIIDGATALGGGGEAAGALGRIGFKATRDIARKDTVCTGLCLVAGTCETVALACSTVKIIPYRGRIYIAAKIVSKGCINFRNACAGEGC